MNKKIAISAAVLAAAAVVACGLLFAKRSARQVEQQPGSAVQLNTEPQPTATPEPEAPHTTLVYDEKGRLVDIIETTNGKPEYRPNTEVIPPNKVLDSWQEKTGPNEESTELRPEYIDITGMENVIGFHGTFTDANGTAEVRLALMGEVELCALELELTPAEGVVLTEAEGGDGVVCNHDTAGGRLYVVLAGSTNITGGMDLCTLRFTVKGDSAEDKTFDIKVNEIAKLDSDGSTFVEPSYHIVCGKIKTQQEG